MKPEFLISACLCGVCSRYDGGCFDLPALRELAESGRAIPFCPESEGGLDTPRDPCELRGGRAISNRGRDCTAEYETGARLALALCRERGLTAAILKEGSPSCGTHRIRDGSHTGRKIPGEGMTAALLRQAGVRLLNEEEALAELAKNQ